MKKLMIAAAIVCAAVFSQAATLDWGASALYWTNDGKTAVRANGSETGYPTTPLSAYLFLDKDSAALSATISALTADLAAGKIDSLDGYAQMRGNSNGEGGWNNSILNDSKNLITGLDAAKYYGQILFLNSDTEANATYFYVSGMQQSDTLDAELPNEFGFGSMKTDGMNAASSWTKIESVPEPTSGLLLLLGVAGLALRRRRA